MKISKAVLCCGLALSLELNAETIAYIHGDISECGVTPASADTVCSPEPFDQMLLTDSGARGLSEFQLQVEADGHVINQFYDQQTELQASFLNDQDVIVFGLHQKIWSSTERAALDTWLRAGGGMLIYSDSASGGSFREVGAQNPVGQTVTNNLIADYGMQVTVDQADGTTGQVAVDNPSIEAVANLTLEGEGVSPVAIPPTGSSVEILIPYTRNVNRRQGLTIQDPVFASLALATVGDGHIVVMFDRQPMWNDGPGSDIDQADNREILRAIINFLAPRPVEPPPPPPPPPGPPSTPADGNVLPPLKLILDDEQ